METHTGVEPVTGFGSDDRSPIVPVSGLHGVARHETDGRVLTTNRRDGVVEGVGSPECADVGRPEFTTTREVDLGALGEHRTDTRPWARGGHVE